MGERPEEDRDEERPESPGGSSPGEPGYEGETTVGDDGFEGEYTADESGEGAA